MKDLTKGSIYKSILLFAFPLMVGNILQQVYNIVDTWVVGHYINASALAAVGTSYAFMTFLYSVIIGLCMGSGILFSLYYGKKDYAKLSKCAYMSFLFIFIFTILINIILLLNEDFIIRFMRVDIVIFDHTKEYLHYIFMGIIPVFLYQFFGAIVRALGNSKAPVVFIGISTVVNIVLDILFVAYFKMGIKGAAVATLIAQLISAILMIIYFFKTNECIDLSKENRVFESKLFTTMVQYSFFTSLQQSIMNFGILMIQGLVNSFGMAVTAAFSAAVKIDTFAYVPVQDFGNAFATFVSQNKGAKEYERIQKGFKFSILTSAIFSLCVSIFIYIFANNLMEIFVSEKEIIQIGVEYLRIEGAFYVGIGILFLLYGVYRGIGQASMSVVLTIISLGTRVLLAYSLSGIFGLHMIWWAIVIGWFLADFVGLGYWIIKKKKLLYS